MPDSLSPLNLVTTILAGKWTLPIVYSLKDRTHRYHEIRRSFPTVTEKMLIATLKKLEKDGLVKRRLYPSVPPKTEYTLTPLGLEALAIAQSANALAKASPLITTAREARKSLFL